MEAWQGVNDGIGGKVLMFEWVWFLSGCGLYVDVMLM